MQAIGALFDAIDEHAEAGSPLSALAAGAAGAARWSVGLSYNLKTEVAQALAREGTAYVSLIADHAIGLGEGVGRAYTTRLQGPLPEVEPWLSRSLRYHQVRPDARSKRGSVRGLRGRS